MSMLGVLAQLDRSAAAAVACSPMTLPMARVGARAGFPSPAEDLGAKRIDLTARLIKHPQATFLIRARGESMREAGIEDGDVLVIDRAINPKNGHVVVAVIEGEFVCKTLSIRAGRMKLKSANPGYPDIVPKDSQTVEVWGVVSSVIKVMPV